MQSSSRQATLGKMALGIKVTSAEGERISFLRATGRYFATILSGLILMIGYLLAAFTQRKQALHDMIAGTLVVRADASPEEVQAGSGTMKISGVVIAFGVLLAFVPVLGIMAAVAIPAYSDYTVRAKMTEAVATGRSARESVQEYYQKNRKLPASLREAGFSFEASINVAGVSARFDGPEVVISVQPRVPQANGGSVLMKAPAAQPTTWTCSTDAIPHKYLPANCRN
jgi:Tfp pilus assembly major pilin PilA